MANEEKKVNLFSMLSFCFAKSDLRVWEDIWEKSSRKMNDIVEKTWKLFAFKTMILSGKLATKKWRTNIGIFFVILHAVFLLNVFFCNNFSNWCQKWRNMMDLHASRKCWILAHKLWKCLNSLLETIYF